MPSTPCRQYRCPNLTTRKDKGYCNEHSDQRSNWTKRPDRTGSTTKRGYGYVWRKIRTQVLKRDAYLCVACKQAGRYVPATDVDHVISKANGGTDELENLQSLCKKCHRSKTANE